MPMFQNIDGTWKRILSGHINVGGTWKRILTGWVNAGGEWKRIHSSLEANLSSPDASGSGYDNEVVYSGDITVNINGGVGPYGIVWTRVSPSQGISIVEISAPPDWVQWAIYPGASSGLHEETWRCEVTDATGQSIVAGIVDVSIFIEESSP